MPAALKIFLMALAIIDDLGAIIIIALFYTHDLSVVSLVVAAGAIAVLAGLNLCGVRRTGIYILVGAILWTAVLKSGGSRNAGRGHCRLYDPAKRAERQIAGEAA